MRTRAVRLSANENPYGPGPRVLHAIQDALGHVSEYPDVAPLIRDLAARWQVPADCVTVGTGGDDLLRRAVDQAPGPVVAAWPGFGVYRVLAEARGKRFVHAELALDGSANPEALIRVGRLLEGEGPAGVIFAANPNNPTGVATSREALLDVARALPNWLVVIDEAYAEFRDVPDPDVLPEPWPTGAIVVRTLSKVYGLAGLRVGYAVGRGWGIERMVRYGDDIPVGVLTVAAARAALSADNAARVARVRRTVVGRRAELTRELEARGFQVLPSQTNFVLATPPPGLDADALALALRERNILIRLGSRLSVPGRVRISVGSGPQQRALLEALDVVLGSMAPEGVEISGQV